MFSSLATFLFGAQATESESTNSETNPVQANVNVNDPTSGNEPAAGDVIEVTSTTPSVAGNQRGGNTVRVGNGGGKRGGAKNRRARQRQQQQQQQQQQQNQQQGGQRKQTPTLTKLLTPNGECAIDEDFNEDEWYIVEKEDEEDDSLPRTDSEEELSVVEQQAKQAVGGGGGATASSRRRQQQHINSHSLYSGPRPQQQRNYLQRTRAARGNISISTLSPPRSVPASENDNNNAVSQSLYAPIAISPSGSDSSDKGTLNGAGVLMEESCMSVYHSIRSSQARIDSFVNLDLGAAELQQQQPEPESEPEPELAQAQTQVVQQQQQQPQRSNSARFDRHAAVELKQQTLARQSQKSNNKKQHQQLCRSAIKRANKVRDFQAKSHRPRRSEMQSCKVVSGANNNRKCC